MRLWPSPSLCCMPVFCSSAPQKWLHFMGALWALGRRVLPMFDNFYSSSTEDLGSLGKAIHPCAGSLLLQDASGKHCGPLLPNSAAARSKAKHIAVSQVWRRQPCHSLHPLGTKENTWSCLCLWKPRLQPQESGTRQ